MINKNVLQWAEHRDLKINIISFPIHVYKNYSISINKYKYAQTIYVICTIKKTIFSGRPMLFFNFPK